MKTENKPTTISLMEQIAREFKTGIAAIDAILPNEIRTVYSDEVVYFHPRRTQQVGWYELFAPLAEAGWTKSGSAWRNEIHGTVLDTKWYGIVIIEIKAIGYGFEVMMEIELREAFGSTEGAPKLI